MGNKFSKIITEMEDLEQKILLGDNEKMKKLAANGVILPPPTKNRLISIMFFLQYDTNKDVSKVAKEKFIKLPENIIVEALRGAMHQYVIAGCYRYLTRQEKQNIEIFKSIIKHQNFKFNVIEKQLKDLSIDLKSYLAEALSFIAPYPSVMKFLVNSEISKAQKQKILDFAERNSIKLDIVKPEINKKADTPIEKAPREEETKNIEENIKTEETLNKENSLTNEELGISEEKSQRYEEDFEAQALGDERKSIVRLINEMTIGEKIKLGAKGNMEVRGLLIKQSNRLIVEAVIKNPMITEQEVAKFAKDKNMHRDVIKIIAGNRSWLRKYDIKLSVVMNPKTSTSRAIKLLGDLRYSDIKRISKAKGITSALRRSALEYVSRQEKKKNKKK